MKEKRYPLSRQGNLLLLRAAAGAADGKWYVLRMILDTGSAHTLLPPGVLEELGCDLDHPVRTVPIITAMGVVSVPEVILPWFHCAGQRIERWPVLAYKLPAPFSRFCDGLLGMDFLTCFQVTILLDQARSAEIILRVPG